jgi:tetratricopeptide (TPR) repeat protein
VIFNLMDAIPTNDLFEMATRYFKDEQYGDCIRLCESVLARKGESVSVRVTTMHLLADAFLDLEQYEKAENTFTSIIEVEKSDTAYANRGFAFMAMKKWDLALRDYLEAIRLNPENISAIDFAAECQVKLGQVTEAIHLLSTVISNGAKYGRLFKGLGLAYSKIDKWSDAYKAFDRAVKLDPNDEYSRRAIRSIEKLVGIETKNEPPSQNQ